MNSFQERFKNKFSTISKLGTLEVDSSNAVNSSPFQKKPAIQLSANQILEEPTYFARPLKIKASSVYSEPINSISATEVLPIEDPQPEVTRLSSNSSMSPQRKKSTPKIPQANITSFSYASRNKGPFVPYTLKDYENFKTDKYYELGGLGPVNVGTEEWVKKKEALYKRKEYAREVNEANNRIPPRPKEVKSVEKVLTGREKALAFAKEIKRPRLKVQQAVFVEEKPKSTLEELQEEHEKYLATIKEMRDNFQ